MQDNVSDIPLAAQNKKKGKGLLVEGVIEREASSEEEEEDEEEEEGTEEEEDEDSLELTDLDSDM